MDIHGNWVKSYRWITFLLAAGYFLYQIATSDYSKAGGPFRFLTIWALGMSFYSASRMLALSENRITRLHTNTAMVTAVVNVMVVFLYWKLYFTDPLLVGGADGIVWHQQYYLHLLGPALQVIDALFIARVFRRFWTAVLPLFGLISLYILWAELFVQRFNSTPTGSVTSGLPYPFLNSLELSGRAVFYATNIGVAVAVLLIFAGINYVTFRRRVMP